MLVNSTRNLYIHYHYSVRYQLKVTFNYRQKNAQFNSYSTTHIPSFHKKDCETSDIGVVGFVTDVNSSFATGSRLAPNALREAYLSDSSNSFSESLFDCSQKGVWKDYGNVAIEPPDLKKQKKTTWAHEAATAVQKILHEKSIPLSFGGDHSITEPILRPHERHPSITIVHFDAHPDLYPDFESNPHSHASPFIRILERRSQRQFETRLLQIGIRTLNQVQSQVVKEYGVEQWDMKKCHLKFPSLMEQLKKIEGPVYVSIDIDVLDPAFAPGVSHHEPGGLTTRELLSLIQGLPENGQAPIVGADIVELNPERDINSMTAMVAAKIFKELLCKICKSQNKKV